MKKKITSIIIMFLLIFIIIEVLNESSLILKSVTFSFSIWINNVFPSLFPFFMLSEILQYFGFVELVSELFKNIMGKLFKMRGECAFILIMSMLTGFPGSAKYTRNLYDKGFITKEEATKILTFTHFSNPLFILGTVSILFLNNKEVGFLILFCHYLGNLIIGILFRNSFVTNETKSKASLKNAIDNMHIKRISNKISFGEMISNSITSSIDTLLMILGTLTFFLVITTIIDNNLNINSYYQSILNGFFEMTQGLKYVSIEPIPLKLKATISVMIISFGGLSVHMQIYGILSKTKISYLPFFTSRVMHAFISSFILYLIFDYFVYFI